MKLNEIIALKKFPANTPVIFFKDRAEFQVERYIIKVSAAGRNVFEYKGHIAYVYANGKTYHKYFRGKGFQKVLKKTYEYFELRNRQMKGYEK